MRRRDLMTLGLTLSAAAAVGTAAAAFSPAPGDRGLQPGGQPGGPQDVGALLVQGLRETEGCLGVDGADWDSGKSSIVAWFDSKEAVLRWYNSPTHRHMMDGMGGGSTNPMAHVPDDQGPIMVVATITLSDRPQIQGFPMPISQISIEMFAPLPGGAHVNGRLAPDSFEVPHMQDLAGAYGEGTGR